MAETNNAAAVDSATKLVSLSLLTYYDGKIKQVIADGDTPAIKAVDYKSNSLYFFKDETLPAEADYDTKAAFKLDLPEEQFLDQLNTKFVDSFAYNANTYPNTSDPNLDGRPVLVLAVKGDTDVSYSFVNLEKLVDVYTGDTSDTANVTITNNAIKVDVRISARSNNAIVTVTDAGEEGLYVAPTVLTFASDTDVDALFNTTTNGTI